MLSTTDALITTLAKMFDRLSLNQLLDFVKRTLVPEGGVKERTVKSGIWVTLINVFDRGLQLAKLIVLARLLSPAAIGLIGITLLVLTVLEQFSEFGVDRALIQRKERNINEYLNTAWSLQIIRGVLVVGIAYVAAPYAAVFFGEPRSTDLIRVLALTSLLTSLRNPGLIYFRKNLDFHKQFAYTLTGSLVNAAVTIATAWIFRSVWAFVFGRLAGNIVTIVLSYLIHEYRPWPAFDRAQARELLGYGKWILGSGVLAFLLNQGDDAFIGWFLSASVLGFYQLAFRFSNAPATEITHTISNVVFPAYSQLQTDDTKLRKGYFRTIQLTTMVSFPMAAGIFVTAPVFVQGFLGEQWLPMVWPMQILTLWGAIRSLGSSTGPLFEAVGRPDYNTKLQVLELAIVVVLIYSATDRWGIAGTAFVVVVSGIVASPIANYLAVRQVEGSYFRLIRVVSYPAVGSAVMAIGVWFVRTNVAIGSSIVEFLFLVTVGIVLYSLVMVGIERRFDIGISTVFNTVISSFR
ncbi:lipopolysaccharide biosynthesis protein [Halococcus saccharolyticus]|uniref:Export protein n=1 Tax=Halococcus saccharolyticus DSM 5350 TaxID=1227455 RepID=M0MJB0_9EURY|nr:lipopolysaccharide biosynthesis protein [Halococcus saccharolyticus]EMA44819.1 export protein [Halococcus saccharolyticus DSM 5350]